MVVARNGGDREAYWRAYYSDVVAGRAPWLDYSNGRVQAQTLALALEAAGPLRDLRCLDVGCGWGQLSRLVAASGAREVTGMDIVPDLIDELRREHPGQRWVCGSPTDEGLLDGLGDFDVVFAVEVLHAVPFQPTLARLWRHVVPGGRLVGVVPSGDCPIAHRTMERFPGNYLAPAPATVREALADLASSAHADVRGLVFRPDQTATPYEAAPWGETARCGVVANRLQFVAVKAG